MSQTDPASNTEVARRLRLLRSFHCGNNQRAFAGLLGISEKRWNNFERGYPLSKEIAFLIVRKFPDVTTDWLWLGKTGGLPQRFQTELEAAAKASTGAIRSGARS